VTYNPQCSCHLLNLRLSHYSHLDYFKFNDVFNFSGPASFDPLEVYGGVIQVSDFLKILFCVPKINDLVLWGRDNKRVSNY